MFFDLHHYAGLNLVHILREGSGYSPRQILILIRQLPLESATVAAIRGGPEFRGWGLDRYLSAQTIDAVRENTYATLIASGNLKKKPKPPEPTYRPEKAKKPKVSAFANMARGFFRAATKPKE